MLDDAHSQTCAQMWRTDARGKIVLPYQYVRAESFLLLSDTILVRSKGSMVLTEYLQERD